MMKSHLFRSHHVLGFARRTLSTHAHRNTDSPNNAASASRYQNYLQLLYKKFLFLTHPDYFASFPQYQKINNQNIGILGERLDSSESLSSSEVRSLTFYIKSTEDMPEPRRVKVSLGTSIHTSLREILEDYDFKDLPALPSLGNDYEIDNATHMMMRKQVRLNTHSVTMEDIYPFLDSLIDRRDLLAWREVRNEQCLKVIDVVKHILGVEEIDLRYTWSATNNAVMFHSLLKLLEKQRVRGNANFGREINLPWTGLKLVFTSDDCTNDPVSSIEGEVQLCPGHVPLQWLEAITSVTDDTIRESMIHRREISQLESNINASLSQFTLNRLIDVMSLEEKRTKVPEAILFDIYKNQRIQVVIKKGFTASNMSYKNFLQTLQDDILEEDLENSAFSSKNDYIDSLNIEDHEISRVEQFRDTATYSNTHTTPPLPPPPPPPPSNNEPALQGNIVDPGLFWISELPLMLTVVVENGHGTKLLNDGLIRVDSRAPPSRVLKLLQDECENSVKFTATRQRKMSLLKELSELLEKRLSLRSISAGVGVNDDDFLGFLRRVNAYLDDCERLNKKEKLDKLKSMRNLSIQAGKYLGFSNDGCVVVPFSLLYV